MAVFYPDWRLTVALFGFAAMQVASAQDIPILLDAASTNYDRRNQQLLFEQVSINRGGLSISADRANSSQLDFADSRWLFSGHVKISSETAQIVASSATMEFVDHRLRRATITGTPAVLTNRAGDSVKVTATEAVVLFGDDDLERVTLNGDPAEFEHISREETITRTQGHARQLTYDVGLNRIRLVGKAWVSQGENEIRGEEITYDIEAQRIIAGGNDNGERVRITITPPADSPITKKKDQPE